LATVLKRKDRRDRIEKITYLGASYFLFFTNCKMRDEVRNVEGRTKEKKEGRKKDRG